MKNYRLRLILIGLLMPLLIWLAWPERKALDDSNAGTQTEVNVKRPGSRFPDTTETNRQNRNQRPSNYRAVPTDDAGLNRVDSLITHRTLSDHEVAEQLLLIAKDKRMSVEVRAEALGHGVILDLPVFASMAADTQLPPEMAEDLLMHVINENQHEALQIRAYKDFLNHRSPEIREEAKEMLAFILEDDFGKNDEAALLRLADAKLKELETKSDKQE